MCGWRREGYATLYVFYLGVNVKKLTRLVSAYKLFVQPMPAPLITSVLSVVNSNVLRLLSITLTEHGRSAPSLA